MHISRKPLLTISAIALFLAAIALRVISLPYGNPDTHGYLQWYDQIAKNGFAALSGGFSVYTPPYLYLLWLATLARKFIPPLLALKLIPSLFDLLSAFAVYKLVRIKFPTGQMPWLAAAGFLLLPTVLVNSSYWGQIDSLYTSFLLWCIYFIMTERPLPALVMFGISASVKGQGIFIFPFLAVLALKKRIPWIYFLIPPIIYMISILPVVWAGRPFMDALTIYISQARTFSQIAMHAPNLYSLVNKKSLLEPAYYGGLVAAVILIPAWIWFYARRRFALTPNLLLLTALLSVVIVPFLLPKMHDRYFYPADNLSFVLMFFWPAFWYVALGYQIISGLVYFLFLHSLTVTQNRAILDAAAILNTIMVLHLVVRQYLATSNDA